jgi:hypothetical protein
VTGLPLLLVAVVAGAFLPVRAGVNAKLAHFVGGAVRASLAGTVCLTVIVALFYRSDGQRADAAPWVRAQAGPAGRSTSRRRSSRGSASVLRVLRDSRRCAARRRLDQVPAEGGLAAAARG